MNDFIETQLAIWKIAADNYRDLGKTMRRKFRLGDFEGALQFNPARIRSTNARIDKESVSKRPCFLCAANRPKEQVAVPVLNDWELLLNPFPIFPVHFTIAAKLHIPQGEIPADMATMAEKWSDLAIFFNGARAGASAPDHAHCQAVLKSELPIIRLAEQLHPASGNYKNIIHTSQTDAELPFDFYSAIITPDRQGMLTLKAVCSIKGTDIVSGIEDPGLVNAIFWMGSEGLLRAVVIPRSAHRPDCFFADEPYQRMVSPGTIDMAGIIVLPRREDFDRLSDDEIALIYSQVAAR